MLPLLAGSTTVSAFTFTTPVTLLPGAGYRISQVVAPFSATLSLPAAVPVMDRTLLRPPPIRLTWVVPVCPKVLLVK